MLMVIYFRQEVVYGLYQDNNPTQHLFGLDLSEFSKFFFLFQILHIQLHYIIGLFTAFFFLNFYNFLPFLKTLLKELYALL